MELAPPHCGVQNRANQQNPHVPAEHQHCHRHRNEPLVHQHQEQRAQQQLVGHRVQVLAQHRPLLQHPRQRAVERVRQSRGNKQDEAERIVVLQDGRHQKRREADAQQCEQVWSRAEWVQSLVRIVNHGRRNWRRPKRLALARTHPGMLRRNPFQDSNAPRANGRAACGDPEGLCRQRNSVHSSTMVQHRALQRQPWLSQPPRS